MHTNHPLRFLHLLVPFSMATACAPALRTPVEAEALARSLDPSDIDRLVDALKSRDAAMRARAAWALGSRAAAEPSTFVPANFAAPLRRAFDAEWKRPGGPDAEALGAMIRSLGHIGESADGEHVAGFMRVLSPSLQGAVARLALGFAARKVPWFPVLDAAVAQIAATSQHPHRHVALVAAARAKKSLPAPTVIDALNSPDHEIHAAAAKASGFSPAVSADRLEALLRSKDSYLVAVEAARALVARKEAARVAHFVHDLWGEFSRGGKTHTAVAIAALEALSLAEPLSGDARKWMRDVFAAARAANAPTLLVAWIDCRTAMLLDTADKSADRTPNCGGSHIPTHRRAALAAEVAAKLPHHSPAIAVVVKPFVASSDSKVRAAILPAVVRLPADEARPIFLKALASTDPVESAVAADTLVSQPPRRFRRLDFARAVIAALKRHAAGNNVEATISLAMATFQFPPGEADAALHDLATQAEPSVAAMARLDRFHDHTRTRLSRPSSWAALDSAAARLDALPNTARITTSKGAIDIRFHADVAPRTVANFAALARKGFFNGLTFHRVVPNFVVQGGDPRSDGWGGPGHTIPCEPSYHERPYVRGSVGMALAGRNTGGSQFFITHAAHPHLDGRYTNFATVTAGMDVVDRILVGDKILGVSVQ